MARSGWVAVAFSILVGSAARASSVDIPPAELLRVVRDVENYLAGLQLQLAGDELTVNSLLEEIEVARNNGTFSDACKDVTEWHGGLVVALEELENHVSSQDRSITDTIADFGGVEARHAVLQESLQDLTQRVNELAAPAPAVMTLSRPRDCSDAQLLDLPSGPTFIFPVEDGEGKEVSCDQDTDGGGWTVLIRRMKQNPQLDFRRRRNEYIKGFGDPEGELWIGLSTIYELTNNGGESSPYEAVATMAIGDEEASSYYTSFKVSSDYRLSVSGYDEERSDAGDSLSYHDGQRFSTIDRDYDGAWGGSCSEWSGGGGWWFNYCFMTNPTGLYGGDRNRTQGSDSYLEWRNWQGYHAFLTDFTLMIRPRRD